MFKNLIDCIKMLVFTAGVVALLGWALLSCNGVPGTVEYNEKVEAQGDYIRDDNNEVWFTFDQIFGLDK